MAHLPDGLLSLPVLLGGSALALAGLRAGLRRADDRQITRISLLSAAFFAASSVAVPLGPSSVHVLLSMVMGLMLGAGVFVAVFVALLLQAALFGLGGITTLGVNTLIIAGPAYLAARLLGARIRRAQTPVFAALISGCGAALATLATAVLVGVALALSASEFVPVASVMALTYLPLALAEALICAAVVGFFARSAPQFLASESL